MVAIWSRIIDSNFVQVIRFFEKHVAQRKMAAVHGDNRHSSGGFILALRPGTVVGCHPLQLAKPEARVSSYMNELHRSRTEHTIKQ
jgi:hypothetical protein